jgi:predicted acyl esterase
VSRRALVKDSAVHGLPVYSVKEHLPVTEGEIVHVEPGITPIGMRFSTGEVLRVCISGVDKTVLLPVDQASLEVEGVEDANESVTVVLHGGLHDSQGSYMTLPVLT